MAYEALIIQADLNSVDIAAIGAAVGAIAKGRRFRLVTIREISPQLRQILNRPTEKMPMPIPLEMDIEIHPVAGGQAGSGSGSGSGSN